MRRIALLLALSILPANVSGVEPPRGVVFVADGIGGFDPLGLSLRLALPCTNVPHEIREFHWTHGKCRILRDLQDTKYFLAKADELAAEVFAVKKADPDRPVYLMGHSAGAALVLAAAERLPKGTLERVIVMSAAVSTTYNLTGALRATKGQIVAFNSAHDAFVLDWGTSNFGTVDRVYGPSAGLKGFEAPADLSPEGKVLYRRLVQVPWKAKMMLEFNSGSHHGPMSPWFVARQVAPWLLP